MSLNLILPPPLECHTLLTPPLHSVCLPPCLSCRYRQRLSVSGADGCCRGSWVLTLSTSSPPQAATATTSAPRSPCWPNAALLPAGHLGVRSTSLPSETPVNSSLCFYHYALNVWLTYTVAMQLILVTEGQYDIFSTEAYLFLVILSIACQNWQGLSVFLARVERHVKPLWKHSAYSMNGLKNDLRMKDL